MHRSAPDDSRPLLFTREQRLVDGVRFRAVFDAPDYRVSDRHFLILARRNGLPHARLGLVVGRRRARRAVDRGALKRRAREQFRLRQYELAGLDLIVLLRAPCPADGGRGATPLLAGLLDKLLAKRGQD
ncbi:ribonuclease P protein component [Alloalcanivorax marinus]|uniref:ribonuclease P protein component n=1 Tax=Alloalcanivorax marinus TaxID=1177169 RepID=UPI0019320891|nr:ribonuclease P protein component [Alloalcanivorax marinus]